MAESRTLKSQRERLLAKYQTAPKPAPPAEGMAKTIAWYRVPLVEQLQGFGVATAFWLVWFWLWTNDFRRFSVITTTVFAALFVLDVVWLAPREHVISIGRDWVQRRRGRRVRWVRTTHAVRVVAITGGRGMVKTVNAVKISDDEGRTVRFSYTPMRRITAFDRTLRDALSVATSDHDVEFPTGTI